MEFIPVAPVIAPSVETLSVLEVNANVPVEFPIETFPVFAVAKFKAPVVPGLIVRALAAAEVISVPIVPLKINPLVRVPEVLVTSMPFVVVPAEF